MAVARIRTWYHWHWHWLILQIDDGDYGAAAPIGVAAVDDARQHALLPVRYGG